MQSIIKTCALSLMFAGLTACGGGGGGGGNKPASSLPSSSSPSSIAATSSSSPASSSAPASSSTPATSAALSSSSVSSAAEGNETTQTATSVNGYSIAKIDNCGVGISAASKTFGIFADYDGGVLNQDLSSLNFSGWNHTTNGSATEWTKLKNAGSVYNFNTTAKVNDSCSGVDTLDMVLLKKIADWDHQHSNGFERNILAHGYKFSDIENLTLDIKINSAKTSIPSVESLKTTYASFASGNNIDDLEDGKVNIGIVIYDGKSASTWMAKKIIQLDQSALADQWIRVTIPMKDMKHCLDENYNCADKPFSELGSKTIAGIQFVAETKTGLVLRNAIDGTTWSSSVPETFKETDLSFKKIEFQLK